MITIVSYDPAWPARFAAEAAHVRQAFGGLALRVEHVGSTSVPGLAAKPVIDIQVSVATLQPPGRYIEILARLGYVHVPLGPFDLVYPFYQKPADWPTTHHLHLCAIESKEERDHLAFRDYLREHPEIAADYVALKRRLATMHDGDSLESRERYSLSKSDFVSAVLQRRLAEGYPSPQRKA